MNVEMFWSMIERAKHVSTEDEQLEQIEEMLSRLEPEQIIEFEHIMYRLLAKSYQNSLWGAAYLVNGGCSDDGFDYFRGWLIAQGKEVFERALGDPDSLADYEGTEENVEFEGLWYIAAQVYKAKVGREIPRTSYEDTKYPDLEEFWDFDDENEMKTRYPKLFRKFGW